MILIISITNKSEVNAENNDTKVMKGTTNKTISEKTYHGVYHLLLHVLER